MAKTKGWKVRIEIFVPADDKDPESVTAASKAAAALRNIENLRQVSSCPDLEITSSSAEFVSRKDKMTPATGN